MIMKLAEPQLETMDDLLVSLGGISPKRVRMNPAPGTATVRDMVRIREKTKRLYELVDGTLVEKIMGAKESFIAGKLITLFTNHSDAHGDLGMVMGEAGMVRLMESLARIPDVSFTNWDRVPNRRVPDEPVPKLVPDLAVEVLSEGNTRAEMEQKLKDYFLSKVALVWFIDPRKRTVRVYTSPDEVTELSEADTLDGGDVLPGFTVKISRLFEQITPAKATGGKKTKKRK